MNAKHTPGPWVVRNAIGHNPLLICNQSGDQIAELCYMNGPEMDDARLIAAAPDLLAALEESIDPLILLGDFIGNTFDGTVGINPFDRCAIIGRIRAAIAKARGE
jgi:hypothetical protein